MHSKHLILLFFISYKGHPDKRSIVDGKAFEIIFEVNIWRSHQKIIKSAITDAEA